MQNKIHRTHLTGLQVRLAALITLLALFLLNGCAQLHPNTQGKTKTDKPAANLIADYGPFRPVADADFKTPVDKPLKALFSIGKTPEDTEKLNPSIQSMARFFNMNVAAGVPPENIQLALVVHGRAVRNLLTNKAHNHRYLVDNPNARLLEELQRRGARIILCGQTMAFGGYQRSELLPFVQVALSAMNAVVLLQDEGYRLINW